MYPNIKRLWLAKKNKPFGMIMNTLKSTDKSKYGHWVAIVFIPNKSINYYDSFGEPANTSIKEDLQHILHNLKPKHLIKFKENLVREQSANSDNCGWFCIKFVRDMFNNVPFVESTPFSRVMKGEKKIKKFKKRFEFEYI